MIGPVLTGVITAVVVFVPRLLYSLWPAYEWSNPVFILGVGAIAMLIQKYALERNAVRTSYGGISDLFFHIHSPFSSQSSAIWAVRGLISFLLTCFGGCAGGEGAAVEFAQATNMILSERYSKWFEQKRRTDVASGLAGGVSAAFGAPFAGLLFPIELGVGGRSITSAMSAVSAFLVTRFLFSFFSISGFEVNGILSSFQLDTFRQWLSVLVIGGVAGVVAVLVIHFVRYTQESLKNLFQTQLWMRTLTAAILLALVYYLDRPLRDLSWHILEQILWLKFTPEQVLLLFFTQLISLAILLAGFGTIGVIWPIFVLGGALGFGVDHWIFSNISTVSGLIGCSAFCGALLGVPFTASIIVYEMTQNIQIILPCLVAALIAHKIRELLRTKTLLHLDLHTKGLTLLAGRSHKILDAITVREAMVVDFEAIHEHEVLSEIRGKVLKSRYPFLPVLNSSGGYTGLLTIDMLQEAWTSRDMLQMSHSLSKLLEVKDLLYRIGNKTPVIQVGDRLSSVIGIFDKYPCLPVLGDDGTMIGLLFVYSVRVAYDREVAKSSCTFIRDADPVIR